MRIFYGILFCLCLLIAAIVVGQGMAHQIKVVSEIVFLFIDAVALVCCAVLMVVAE